MEVGRIIKLNRVKYKMSVQSTESGYSSDDLSPSPNNFYIRKDAKRFERRYCVDDILIKSANGILYNGFDRRSGNSVVVKQIPREGISGYKMHKNRLCPLEIYYHLRANSCANVVHILDWFEKKSSFVGRLP